MTDTKPARWTEYLPVADLAPASRNAKAHDRDALARSMTAFGFIEPIVLDERTGRIVAGHGRAAYLAALADEGGAPPDGVEVDDDGTWRVAVTRGWRSESDEHADAAGIALNRVGERGGWQTDALAEMLTDLLDQPYGEAVGFDTDYLDDLLASMQEATPTPPTPVEHSDEDRTGNSHAESTYEDWAAGYRNKQVRSMVFDYPLEDYQQVVMLATAARARYGVESNAELFQAMLVESDQQHAVTDPA